MTKTLNQIFFSSTKIRIFFFSNIGNQNIFLEKKTITPLPWKLNGPSLKVRKCIFDLVGAKQICIIQTGSFQRNLINKNYLQIWVHSTTFISETTTTKSNLFKKSSSKFHIPPKLQLTKWFQRSLNATVYRRQTQSDNTSHEVR
jgi:hypothetical protein